MRSSMSFAGELAGDMVIAVVVERQQVGDFFKCEADGLRALDEAQAVDMVVAVTPDSVRLRGSFQEPPPLVVAHRLHAHVGSFGELADAQIGFHQKPLDSVLWYGV